MMTKTQTVKNRQKRQRKKTKTRRGGAKATPFDRQHFRSGDGMVTKIWGPPMWHALHTISFNYPLHPSPQEKKHYRDFLLQLQYVLPCKYCRSNLTKNFQAMPLRDADMANRATFSLYLYRLHERINTMLGKKSGLTYEDVRERYEHFRARCTIDPASPAETTAVDISDSKAEETKLGCTEPLYGKKAKCLLQIVPQEDRRDTFHVESSCLKRNAQS
jgi:Erv1 / Alr family